MSSMFITFRGDPDVEIEFRDYGYEWDTGAHDVEWEFTDPNLKDVEVTEHEEQEIFDKIVEYGRNWVDDFTSEP